MQDRRKYQRVWLLAHGRFERAMRKDIAVVRNRYVTSAAKYYGNHGTVPAYIRAAYETALGDVFTKHLQKIVPHFGKIATRELKSRHRVMERKAGDTFFLTMMEWARTRALNNASTVADTDTAIVRKHIEDGLEAGDGNDAIARRIRDTASLTPYRAATIARTETSVAANYGAIEEARQTSQEIGIVLVKEWVATSDDRTRQAHIDADGQTVELDEDFQVDGEGLDSPCDPSGSPENVINCRCAANYVEKE
jgi:hypothetical protein